LIEKIVLLALTDSKNVIFHSLDGVEVFMALTTVHEINIQNNRFEYSLYTIYESFVSIACMKFLKDKDIDQNLKFAIDDLLEYLEKNGLADNGHGKLFEKCVLISFYKKFNGKKISELDFFKGYKLPSWCEEITLKCDTSGVCKKFNFDNDFECISEMIEIDNTYLLNLKNQIGQDGLILNPELKDKKLSISFSVKFHCEGVSWTEHLKSFKTTDINWMGSKYKKNMKEISQKELKNIYNIEYKGDYETMNNLIPILFEETKLTQDFKKVFEKYKKNIYKIRIHVEYPHAQNCQKFKKFNYNEKNNELCIWIGKDELNTIFEGDLPDILNNFVCHKKNKNYKEE
jgi:hypothetical protein